MSKIHGHRSLVALILLLIVTAFIAVTSNALASSGGDYVLDWYTMDGGGGTSTGGDYNLSGTIGQPDAGQMSGGDYTIGGGFWSGVSQFLYDLFLPLIMR